MSDFVISAENGETEAVFMAYKNEQRIVRANVARLWQEADATLAAYAKFAEQLAEGGELAAVADYHAEVAGQLAGAESQLLQAIGQTKALIEAINNAAPGTLFYGVPKAE